MSEIVNNISKGRAIALEIAIRKVCSRELINSFARLHRAGIKAVPGENTLLRIRDEFKAIMAGADRETSKA